MTKAVQGLGGTVVTERRVRVNGKGLGFRVHRVLKCGAKSSRFGGSGPLSAAGALVKSYIFEAYFAGHPDAGQTRNDRN